MDSATFQELKDRHEKLCEERDVILRQIEENNILIQEADCHIKSILEENSEDFKVFSPRTVESIHREELDQLGKRMEEYRQQNNQLFHERNKLNSTIELLEKILKENNGTNSNLKMLEIQEEERQRIARDLHDTSLQNLAHLIHKIELGTMFIDQDPVRAKLELAVVSKNLKEIINDIRNTIFNLRPMTFDDLGLKAAFERLISQLNSEKLFELDLQLDDVSCENDLVMVTIYRIVQESLTNIYKHAEADKIFFRCSQENNVCLIDIRDNGKGFDWDEVTRKENKHFGLSLMKERVALLGGKFDIVSEKNSGTKIRVEIPLG